MLKLLKRLGYTCWGDHEWIYRTGGRGLWLECRHCGLESAGLDLPTARYHRTQDATPELLAAPPPRAATATARVAPADTAQRQPATPMIAMQGVPVSRAPRWLTDASPIVGLTDGERRWLQAWRAMTPDERVLAERLVARVSAQRERDAVPHAS